MGSVVRLQPKRNPLVVQVNEENDPRGLPNWAALSILFQAFAAGDKSPFDPIVALELQRLTSPITEFLNVVLGG